MTRPLFLFIGVIGIVTPLSAQPAKPTDDPPKAALEAATLWSVPMQFKFDAHMVAQIAFSPNGKYLAAVATDVNLASALRIHDVAEDKEHLRIGGATWGYRCITFTSDSKKIFASGHGNAQPMPHAIRGWSLDKGVESHLLQGYAEEVIALQMLEDDKTLASVHADGTVRYWDLDKNQEKRRWKSPAVKFAGIALAQGGITLAVTRDDNTIELLNALTGAQIREIAKPKDRTARLTFSPDGRLLLRVPNDGKSIQVFEVASGLIRHDLPRQSFTTMWSPLAISPDNSLVAFSDKTGRNNAGVLLRLSDGRVVMQDYAYWRYTVAFSNDRKRLAAGQGKTNWMNLWDVPAEKVKEKPLTDVQLESLWADLLDEKDGVKAYRAMHALILAPSQTVALVNKQLDKRALDAAENDQRLRASRVIEVLECIGNRECKQILERITKDAKSQSLRDDARQSLRRLALLIS